jgi:acyl-CoA reductase-like NAD-dependent aldehyde dehydrogenase
MATKVESSNETRRSLPTLKSMNPRTGEVVGEVPASSPNEVADVVAVARKVAPEWAAIDPAGRAHLMKGVRQAIHDNLDEIVETIAEETGKPRAEALATDVLTAALTLLYYERTSARNLRAERAGGLFGPLSGLTTRIEWRPFGVVGAITPWNYPFGLAISAVAPALFAGNAVILKPSEVTPRVGELVRKLLDVLPSGVAQVIQGDGDVGAALVDAPCDKICFIGSPATGRKIAASAARHLTPVVMELGGKDAAIVCDDADLDVASSGVLWSSLVNAGQTCAAVERVYVVDSVAEDFKKRLVAKLARLKQRGLDPDIGSLTFGPQLDIVREQLADALDKGARVVAGGPERGPGNDGGSLWFEPTILEGVSDEMAMWNEETFGPLVPIVAVADENEAVTRTNSEAFSLTASIWTKNKERAERLASRLRAGAVTINAHAESYGAPWAPWGGVGESGYGRLNGKSGLREFVYPTVVARNTTPSMRRLWWYPYDYSTHEALRGVVTLVASTKLKEKVKGVPAIARNAGRALKAKI